jgi:hypothetical protein
MDNRPNGWNDKELCYPYTNECLEAIIGCLCPNESDNVLAIGASGDQAFALAESGANVTVIDKDPAQLEYIQRRMGFLREDDYSGFFDFVPRESVYVICRKVSMDYFDRERFEMVRENVNNIKICETPVDITKNPSLFAGMNKIYLSNVSPISEDATEFFEGLSEFTEFPCTVYFSSQSCHLIEPAFFETNFDETIGARAFEMENKTLRWMPIVFSRHSDDVVVPN